MHLPNTPIRTPYRTREQHFREALALLKAKVAKYMERPDTSFDEIYPPRSEVNHFIFETAEDAPYESDDQCVLYLAVEDLSLVQLQPVTLDVRADDDDPPWAEYLIRTKFEEWINEQLYNYVQEHPLCCEMCGREPATWFWFPHANDTAASPELLTGDQRWGIGNTCKSVLDSGEPLHFVESERAYTSESRCLIPIKQEQTAQEIEQDTSGLLVVGTVPCGYQTLAELLTQIERLFDGWLDHVTNSVLGKVPTSQEVENAIVSITLTRLPNLYDPLHLVLLAIEESALATRRPEHYDKLVEANNEDITAALLLWCALIDHVSTWLRQRWQQRQQMGQ